MASFFYPISCLISKKRTKLLLSASCYYHLLDGVILFTTIEFTEIQFYDKNEMTLICAKFGAHLIDISETTSCKSDKTVASFFSTIVYVWKPCILSFNFSGVSELTFFQLQKPTAFSLLNNTNSTNRAHEIVYTVIGS